MLAEHGLVDASNTVMVVANAGQATEVRAAMTGIDGLGEPSEPVALGGIAFVEATVAGDVASTAAFDRVTQVRDRVHAVEGADALVGGWSAIYLDTKVAANRDNLVIIPIVLLVVFLILVLLLRAVAAPLILLATVVLSFSAALGISALLFEYVFGFAGSDPGFAARFKLEARSAELELARAARHDDQGEQHEICRSRLLPCLAEAVAKLLDRPAHPLARPLYICADRLRVVRIGYIRWIWRHLHHRRRELHDRCDRICGRCHRDD